MLAPPGGWHPLLGEILDPALVSPELNPRNPLHDDEEAGKGRGPCCLETHGRYHDKSKQECQWIQKRTDVLKKI